MVSRVLVAIDSADDLPLVENACRIADEHHARLELVGGIPRACFTVAFVACPRSFDHELEQHGRALLADAVARVPAHLPVTARHVRGCARDALLREGDADGTRLLLVGALPWWARSPLCDRLRRLAGLRRGPGRDGRDASVRERARTVV
ncbi:MAG TPA: hypothetical protein VHF51_18170 [Solirubrobacteraceae bacterium]|nr:hypothetical protein [Solirubrobacteraceae bacterium]